MCEKEISIVGVILAGGKNSRFGGTDKAFCMVNGTSMIETITNTLLKCFAKVIIVSNSPDKHLKSDCVTVISDLIKESGPLGGIYSAMKHAKSPYIFVTTCDMPFLDPEIIKKQVSSFCNLGRADVYVPKIEEDRIEPLHSIFSTDLVENIHNYLKYSNQKSVHSYLKTVKTEFFLLPDNHYIGKVFTNINRYEDLK